MLTLLPGLFMPAAVVVPGNGPDLAMTSPSYAAGGSGFGQELTGGSGTVTLTCPAGDRTIELWFRASAISDSGQKNLVKADTDWGIGISENGGFVYMVHGGYSNTYNVNMCDGVRRHFRFVEGPGKGSNLYVNGVSVTNDNYNANNANPVITVTAAGSATGWGVIDEVRISKIARSTANFTPPTAPFTWDTDTVGLWHLDGSGVSA
jgi:hypothetical protein